MKKLLLIFATLISFAAMSSDVATSPGCTNIPQVASGGGLPVGPCAPAVVDPRRANIRAYWDTFAFYPSMIADAMVQFGVNPDEIEDAIDYKVNIVHYLRYNKVTGVILRDWDDSVIDQYLNFYGADVTDKWARVRAQDVLDIAERRKALYAFYGMSIPDEIAPWEHPRPTPVAPQPIQPCVNGVCVVTGP